MRGGFVRATELLGNINDPAVVIALERRLGGPFDVDPVDLSWHEAHLRTQRKRSRGGRELEIDLGPRGDDTPLADGDVIAVESVSAAGGRPVAIAVRLKSVDALIIDIDPAEPAALARVAWEVGNMHVPLFRGRGPLQLVAPVSPPLQRLLEPLSGVSLRGAEVALDPGDRLSGNGISLVARLAPDLKITVRRREPAC